MNTRFILFLTLTATLISCQSQGPKLNPQQKAIAGELEKINPAADPITSKTAIVDVHVHTFNARYLPLRGILQGKRDKAGILGWLLSDAAAAELARVFVDRTELEPFGHNKGAAADTGTVNNAAARKKAGLACKIIIGLIDKAAEKGAWKPGMSTTAEIKAIEETAEHMTFAEKRAITVAADIMGMKQHIETPPGEKSSPYIPVLRFFWTITQNDERMAQLFRSQHRRKGGSSPKITIVSHMMDLGPVYNQPPGADLLDFEKEQIPRMEARAKKSGGDFIYFVAYNPYRDHAEGGKPGDALRIVQDAVLNHGAKGVKVYPPSGYRVSGNDIKRRPLALLTKKPGQQWDQRYAALGSTSAERNAALDLKIKELLLWCIQHDVPVFTHSGYGEFEARNGYGKYHANPDYWEAFLKSHPDKNGGPCKLRLCLGHAGGDDYWFGTGKLSAWGAKAYDLCRTYPNVYCEVSTDGHMTGLDTLAYFVDLISGCIKKTENTKYPFSKKLLYGTDWYLPDSKDPRPTLDAAQRAFLHPSLSNHYEDYFHGNARRYLKLTKN